MLYGRGSLYFLTIGQNNEDCSEWQVVLYLCGLTDDSSSRDRRESQAESFSRLSEEVSLANSLIAAARCLRVLLSMFSDIHLWPVSQNLCDTAI